MPTLKKEYTDCKNYSENIMGEISKILDENEIPYIKKNDTEIVVNDIATHSKESVTKTIYDNISIPKISFIILVDIIETSSSIFIRQKTK